MTAEKVKRKLAAILSADVKGYSRLMGEDEVGTIRTLKVFKEVMIGFIQVHQGRVVGTAGDSLLADFSSVVDAVQCAVEIQKELKTRNADIPESHRMQFRIGINLGDVVEEADTIYGDGVNIAARLESLAEAGGLCISGSVYDQVKNKIALGYEFLGDQTVKNIAEPVRVYRVLMEPGVAVSRVATEKKTRPSQWQRVAFSVGAVLVVAVVAVAIWKLSVRPTPPLEVASKAKMAFPLPDNPSIAVLPFVNMSGDPKQESLCDGMTEEIITALTKIRDLFVISRQSTFTYKGKPVKVKQVSEELGVRYVLEGSVQRSADRIRINAQLIDAITGNHIWAERYERDLKDIFALQDEITLRILTAIRVKLTDGEQASMSEKSYEKYLRSKKGLDCYLKYLEAGKYLERANMEEVRMARRIAEEAIAMCPELADAYVSLGLVHLLEFWMDSEKSPQESIEKGIEMTQKAIARNDSIANAHALLAHFYSLKREYDKAIAEGERAIALSPGSATAHEFYGLSLFYAGRPEEAIPMIQKAIRLNPFSPTHTFLYLGNALRLAGRFEEAVSAYKNAVQIAPDSIGAHLALAGTYSAMGLEKEARAEAAEVLRIDPKFSLDLLAKRTPVKDREWVDRNIAGLRKAGLK